MHPTDNSRWRDEHITFPQIESIVKMQMRLGMDSPIPKTKGEARDLIDDLLLKMADLQSKAIDDDDNWDDECLKNFDHSEDQFSIY